MQVISEGSVRVDLVGGTLDLEPINLILPNVVTLNVATGLKAKVILEQSDEQGVRIVSSDYNKEYFYHASDLTSENILYSDKFEEMSFVLQILNLFDLRSNLKVSLSSGAPAGSGLGGSSAMGVTLYKALCEFSNRDLDITEAVLKVKGVEGRILNQGIPGYQDYYPALTGGILCLWGEPGEIHYKQLFTPALKEFLESHLTLLYSGISRNSGINNWDVYKGFFDHIPSARKGLSDIAKISFQFLCAIEKEDFQSALELIGKEGEERKQLAPGIVPKTIADFQAKLQADHLIYGLKMCGAGGGGCFILTHAKDKKDQILNLVKDSGFTPLDFEIEQPYAE